MYIFALVCVHVHVFIRVCNSPLASVTKIQLVHISCLIQFSGACSRHGSRNCGEPCRRWEDVDISLNLVHCQNVD